MKLRPPRLSFTEQECIDWMREAGFNDIRLERLDSIAAATGLK